VKENVLFGKPYNEDWYRKCFEICELKADFDINKKEDERVVGPMGNNLSGG
jgi:ATP-binding cassette subfamily C (CFTR/MRP) protein 1